jgi:hypothetical protein
MEAAMASQWFNFSLGFSAAPVGGDTVRFILSRMRGLTVHVEGTGDVVVDTFDQDAESPDDTWPVYLVGWMFDGGNLDNDFRGAPVRIPLAGTSITII